MTPRELIDALMKREGLNPTRLAALTGYPSMQGQLSRFLRGKVQHPALSTAERLSKYFRIPLAAVFDERAAREVARERGLDSQVVAEPTVQWPGAVKAEPQIGREAAAVEELARVLAGLPPRTRRAIVGLVADLAEHPEEGAKVAEEVQALVNASRKQVSNG